MSTIFHHPKRKTFYHRSLVPHRLQPYFKGRQQLWRSLKTEDKDEAILRSAQWTARIHQLFLTLKKQGDRMTDEQREALVTHWLEIELDEAEDARTLAGPLSDDHREGVWHVLSDQGDEALVTNNWRTVEREADALLQAAGLPALDHDGADFGRLCRRLLLAKQEYLRIEAERWEGKYVNNRVPVAPTTSTVKAPAAGPLFSIVVDKFLAETPRAARSAKPLKVELLKFVSLIGGDRPMTAITKGDCRQYKEHLLNDRKLSMMTTAKHLSAVGAVFTWAALQGYVSSENPVKGLAPSKKIISKTMLKRRPFTEDELLTVFGSKAFLTQRDTNAARYWIPLLCLFNICRREEASQLSVADIQEEQGIPFLRLKEDDTLKQTLKNEGSQRRVPLHSSLSQLGVLDYVQTMKQAGHVRLFPELTKGPSGYGDPVGSSSVGW
jgi:integrase